MSDLNYNPEKQFNTPHYIQIPDFLFMDTRLERTALLLAGYIYSLHTAHKRIKVSNAYLAHMTSVGERNVRVALQNLEELGYIERRGQSGRRFIVWIHVGRAIIEYDENLDTPDPNDRPTRIHRSGVPGSIDPPYKKDNIKDNTTTSKTTVDNLEIASSSIKFEQYKNQETQSLTKLNETFEKQTKEEKFKKEALTDSECLRIYRERFSETGLTLEYLYQECCDYWSQTNQLVYKARFLKHLQKCPISKLTVTEQKSAITPDERLLIQDYLSHCRKKLKPSVELKNKIISLRDKLAAMKTAQSREILSDLDKAQEIGESISFAQLAKEAVKKVSLSEMLKKDFSWTTT